MTEYTTTLVPRSFVFPSFDFVLFLPMSVATHKTELVVPKIHTMKGAPSTHRTIQPIYTTQDPPQRSTTQKHTHKHTHKHTRIEFFLTEYERYHFVFVALSRVCDCSINAIFVLVATVPPHMEFRWVVGKCRPCLQYYFVYHEIKGWSPCEWSYC